MPETDDITAQRILQDWATSKHWGTTLTVDKKVLYFHYDVFNGFANLDFSKTPLLTLTTYANSDKRFYGMWTNYQKNHDVHELNLANPNVISRIERILERTMDELLERM